MQRHPRSQAIARWDGVTRKVLAAMIVTGGLLTLASFAKYVDHGALISNLLNHVHQIASTM